MKGDEDRSGAMSACELLAKFNVLSSSHASIRTALAVVVMHAANACNAEKVLAPTDELYVKQSLSEGRITHNTFSGIQYVTKPQYNYLTKFSFLCDQKNTSQQCEEAMALLVNSYNNCTQSST